MADNAMLQPLIGSKESLQGVIKSTIRVYLLACMPAVAQSTMRPTTTPSGPTKQL